MCRAQSAISSWNRDLRQEIVDELFEILLEVEFDEDSKSGDAVGDNELRAVATAAIPSQRRSRLLRIVSVLAFVQLTGQN